jgi:hypothetical protein
MMKNALVFAVLLALVPIPAYAAQSLQPVAPVEPITVTRTLAVTVSGQGTVTSNPAGIDCTNGTGQCSHAFPINTLVALLATAPRPMSSGIIPSTNGAETQQGRLQRLPWSWSPPQATCPLATFGKPISKSSMGSR